MSPNRSYSGPAIDATYQYITERPELEEQAERTVYATDPDQAGEDRTENIPRIDNPEPVERPDVDGQSTWADWGGERA